MADLRQRGNGTKEEVRLSSESLSSAKFSLLIFDHIEERTSQSNRALSLQISALEHFLKVEGWTSHALLPEGWKIRLKRFSYYSPDFSLF